VSKLTAPLDADLNFCGIGEFADYPYLYLTDFTSPDPTHIFQSGLCVKTCPETLEEGLDCKVNDQITSCVVDAEKHYSSTAYVEYCLPKDWASTPPTFKAAYEAAKSQLQSSSVGSIFIDIYLAKYAIMISLVTAIILCVVYTALMSKYSEPLAYVCITLTALGLVGASVTCWYMRG
jgi:hypothetical protein